MTTLPGAKVAYLGPQTEPRMTAHDLVVVHTMAGGLAGTDGWFRVGNGLGFDGTEAHIGIGGATDGPADGEVRQWQDLDYQADANWQGNHRCISVETSDGGDPDRPWSAAQAAALVDTLAWLCRRYGIPPRLVPDSRPGRRGIAYHRQGIDPWRAADGERWSKTAGKPCPGPVRIRQLVHDVIPAVVARLAQQRTAETTGDDMPTPQDLLAAKVAVPGTVFDGWTLAHMLAWLCRATLEQGQRQTVQGRVLAALAAGQQVAQADLDAIQAAVVAPERTQQ